MSNFFGKRNQVIFDDVKLKSPPLSIDFDIPFADDENENTGHITIYNLSKETLNKIKKGTYLILQSGYVYDMGTISTFIVKEVDTKLNGVDRQTDITVGEEDGAWKKSTINKTWRAGINASSIIRDIVKSLNLTLGELSLPYDMQYPRGKTFCKEAKLCLMELVLDCRAKMVFTRGTIYIRSPEAGTDIGVILNKNTGLIGTPEKNIDEQGNITYTAMSLMNYRLETGSIVKIESSTLNGFFRIKKGSYKSNDSDHVVEMELIETPK